MVGTVALLLLVIPFGMIAAKHRRPALQNNLTPFLLTLKRRLSRIVTYNDKVVDKKYNESDRLSNNSLYLLKTVNNPKLFEISKINDCFISIKTVPAVTDSHPVIRMRINLNCWNLISLPTFPACLTLSLTNNQLFTTANYCCQLNHHFLL
jgi:hypothetical protein